MIRKLMALVLVSLSVLQAASFQTELRKDVTRPFLGKNFWPNPLMDWQIHQGAMEVVLSKGGGVHDVHVLTHQLKPEVGNFYQTLRLSMPKVDSKKVKRAGFKFGIVGEMPEEYRSNLFRSSGLMAGITSEGKLFGPGGMSQESLPLTVLRDVLLVLKVNHEPIGMSYTLDAYPGTSNGQGKSLLQLSKKKIKLKNGLLGNLALFGAYDKKKDAPSVPAAMPTFEPDVKFLSWTIVGDKVMENLDQTFGPILWSQYSLHRGVVKMTVQIAPLGKNHQQKAHLELWRDGSWARVQSSSIHQYASTAHFRLENWDDRVSVPYRVVLKDGEVLETWQGTIRKNPEQRNTIKLAVLSCMIDKAFPNQYVQQNVLAQDPDVAFFAGDQLYEGNGGYGIVRAYSLEEVPRASLNYLHKYWMFGWSFREVMKDRPSVIIPDDHDVFHPNIWGLGGAPVPEGGSKDAEGGYVMHPEWVRMVERTQVSNLPDPYDPTPVLQDIGVYYTDMNYGGVSFAVVEDRKFKSGPAEAVDPATHEGRVDHVRDPNLDPKVLDKPGLKLLGDRQEKFLQDWADDYSNAAMKAILSQSPFCAVATHHGGGDEKNVLIADLDSNGWPQSGRNRAIDLARRAHAIMIHGDQHLATLVHHGVDEWNDGGFSFAGAGICNGYPRLWAPEQPGKNRRPGTPEYTGEFLDGFHNKINVWAAANRVDKQYPEKIQGKPMTMFDILNYSASGYGMVKFHKQEQQITVESWPVYKNMSREIWRYTPHQGWPVTLSVDQQYAREAFGYLPTIQVEGVSSYVVKLYDESTNELIYARRVYTDRYQPKVFKAGKYRLEVGDNDQVKVFKGLEIVPEDSKAIKQVRF